MKFKSFKKFSVGTIRFLIVNLLMLNFLQLEPLFSKDKSNISYFLKNIRYGRVWVNDNLINFPELPLGGFRQSGIGRESGVYGLDSYTEIRSVIIKL